MDNKEIRFLKDNILDYANRLELVQALILNRMDIYTTGIYSERVPFGRGSGAVRRNS